jgi:hypothetical protein
VPSELTCLGRPLPVVVWFALEPMKIEGNDAGRRWCPGAVLHGHVELRAKAIGQGLAGLRAPLITLDYVVLPVARHMGRAALVVSDGALAGNRAAAIGGASAARVDHRRDLGHAHVEGADRRSRAARGNLDLQIVGLCPRAHGLRAGALRDRPAGALSVGEAHPPAPSIGERGNRDERRNLVCLYSCFG